MARHRKEDRPDRKDETVPKFRPIMPKTNTTADKLRDRHAAPDYTETDKKDNERDSRK